MIWYEHKTIIFMFAFHGLPVEVVALTHKTSVVVYKPKQGVLKAFSKINFWQLMTFS